MIISITGNPGSGKSTIAKILVEKLKAQRINVGSMFREMARERGLTLEEFNLYAKSHPEVDIEADRRAAAQARTLEKNGEIVLAEGRMQFHFLPESLKIFVYVDPAEGSKRIWKDLQSIKENKERNQKEYTSYEETLAGTVIRDAEDAKRYEIIYGVDIKDLKKYDFIVDTTSISAPEAATKIVEFIENSTQKRTEMNQDELHKKTGLKKSL